MDANKYINTYVDTAIGTLQEYLIQILQFKTQLKLVNDMILEKDRVIAEKEQAFVDCDRLVGEQNQIIQALDAQIEHHSNEINSIRVELSGLIEENTGLKNKSTHIESCLKTVGDLKAILGEKDKKIAELELALLPTPEINKKMTKPKMLSGK